MCFIIEYCFDCIRLRPDLKNLEFHQINSINKNKAVLIYKIQFKFLISLATTLILHVNTDESILINCYYN
jgi:hypothetical protein